MKHIHRTLRVAVGAGAMAALAGCADSPLPTAPRLADQPSLAAAGGGSTVVKSMVGLEPLFDARINYSFATGISDGGIAVGSSFSADPFTRAVIWDGSTFAQAIGPAGTSEVNARAILPDGSVIVGYVYPKAVRWVKLGGAWTQLELPDQTSSQSCRAEDIAADGAIAGTCDFGGGDVRAVAWQNGNMRILGAGSGIAVNAKQQVLVQNGATASIWDLRTAPPTITPVGSLGGSATFGSDINDLGQVVGSAENAAGALRPYVWSAKKGMVDLGTIGGGSGPGFASAINNDGVILGSSGPVFHQLRATLWAKGKVVDLGVLPGYQTSTALAINASGQVAGYSSTSTSHRATLWTVNLR